MDTRLAALQRDADLPRLVEEELHRRHIEHRQRCGLRLGMSEAAVGKMVESFINSHGGVTQCPTAYAVMSRQKDV